MKRTVALLVFVLAALTPSAAGAGGWAVGSLDPLPPVRAGESVDVGFRLLQHGQTPVVAAEWMGATIGLAVRADGKEWFVPATAVGEPGHYVAVVDVPAGIDDIGIAVQMRNGLFVDRGMGAGDGRGPPRVAAEVTVGCRRGRCRCSPSVPSVCAALILVDLRATRRRREDLVATTPTA